MADLVGTPSDETPEILDTGRADITTLFVSMSGRHPEGRDAEYMEWHGLDHEPEQHRLPSLRASKRLVSTPACRAARAAGEGHYDGIDHLMTYFFAETSGLAAFDELSLALTNAGRNPYRRGLALDVSIPHMPLVEMGAYHIDGMAAAARTKVGSDVLPWWPAQGVYVLLEQGTGPASALVAVDGVAGAWWGTGIPSVTADPGDTRFAHADNSGLQITYAFLDGDPADTGERLRPILEERWSSLAVTPLLAAPFHTVVRYDWDRYLP